MTRVTRIDLMDAATARPGERGAGPADVRLVRAELDSVAGELACLWRSALARGDFDEITRLADAGTAVHRAVVALTTDCGAPDRRVLGGEQLGRRLIGR